MAIDDLIKEHADYVKSRTPATPYTPGMPTDDRGHYYDTKTQQWLPLAPASASGIQDLIDEHKKKYPDVAGAAKPPPPWYDQPVDKAGTMPMTDEYGRAIPGSEGMSTASMTPRQLAVMALAGASIPASAAVGAGTGALLAGTRMAPYAVTGAQMATNALLGGTSGAIAGEGTGGIAAGTIAGALLPGFGPAVAPLANNRLLTNASALNWLLRGASLGLNKMGAPHAAHALDVVSHYLPTLPVAGNIVAKTGEVVSNPLTPAYVPAVNSVVGTVP